ncbi:hypothetical protein NW762_005785, partial [Fusarium torreyae]
TTPTSANPTNLQLRHPRIADNPEDDQIVESAVRGVAHNDKTRNSIKSQVTIGQRLHFRDLHLGDIMFLCTYHSIYGEASRKYLYWRKVLVEGQTHLVFLTLVTLDKEGVGKSPHWFLEPIGYQFQEGYYKGIRAFLSWTQAVAIKSSHQDRIAGNLSAFEATKNDKEGLKAHVSHLLSRHIDLLSLFCKLQYESWFFLNEKEKGERYLDIQAVLQESLDKDGACRCKFFENLYQRFQTMTNKDYVKYFPIDPERVQRLHATKAWKNRNAAPIKSDSYPKKNDDKCRPPKDFCWCMTGEVVPFDPSIHNPKSRTLETEPGF